MKENIGNLARMYSVFAALVITVSLAGLTAGLVLSFALFYFG
jgi:uncharacterized MAPEG superfamily protein